MTNKTSQTVKKLILQFEPVKETYIWDKETAIAIVSKYDKMEEALKWIGPDNRSGKTRDEYIAVAREALDYDPINDLKTPNGFTPEQEKQILKETEEAKNGKRYTTAKELHDDIIQELND